MGSHRNFWVLGGDRRQAELARLLAADGHTVHTLALEGAGPLAGVERAADLTGLHEAHCVVFPLPAEGEPGLLHTPLAGRSWYTDELMEAMTPAQILCGGRVSQDLRDRAAARQLSLHDYFDREELAVANAIPTAEGAIQIALEELPTTLAGSQVLLLGYGRLGRALAPRLRALGAQVTVGARSYAQLAWIEADGCRPVHLDALAAPLCRCDLVINTAPALLLDEEALNELRPGVLVIDLASSPGGVDWAAAKCLGVRAVHALALPGKVAPVTAGRTIQDAIYHILHELGV